MKQKVEITENQKRYFSTMRACNYDIVCYLELDEIIEILNSLNPYKYAISPKHDKDIKDNGELKKEHIHLILCFGTKKRGTQLVRLFNTTEIRVINNTAQLKGSYDYLTHESKNCEGKVKYEKSNRLSNDFEYFETLDESIGVDNAYDIIDRINMRTPIKEMVKLYGKDFVYHYDQYIKVAQLINEEEQENRQKKLNLELEYNKETGEIQQLELI